MTKKELEPEQAIWELLFDLQNEYIQGMEVREFLNNFKTKIVNFWGEDAWNLLLLHYHVHPSQFEGDN